MTKLNWTVPTLSEEDSIKAIDILQGNLYELNDLALVLKHAHWNVTGQNFIAVHEMLDPQIEVVRAAVDAIAERIATLGGHPDGRSEGILNGKKAQTYKLDRASAIDHINALNDLYTVVITRMREGIASLSDLDQASSDLLAGQVGDLELFQWFLRSHTI